MVDSTLKYDRRYFFILLLSLTSFQMAFGIEDECTEYLAQIFERGIDRNTSIGFHGTSIEAIEEARLHGFLKTGEAADNEGKWYFFPNLEHPTIKKLLSEKTIQVQEGILHEPITDKALKTAWEGALGYAQIIAEEHRFLKELGLEINDANRSLIGAMITRRQISEEEFYSLKQLGFSREKIRSALKVSLTAKGVILALGAEVPYDGHKHGTYLI